MNYKRAAVFMMSLLALCSAQLASAEPIDVKDHWASKEITTWEEKRLIQGYDDNTFKPDNNITRAEFITLINRASAFFNQTAVNYSDVSTNDWFVNEIAKAQAAGYIDGYGDGTIRPNNLISRQEAATVIYKLLQLNPPVSKQILTRFSDAEEIADWSKEYISSVAENGYMDGYPDRTFKPAKYITRAESVSLLNRAFGEIINKAGEQNDKTFEGNVTANISGVRLKNVKINGNLYLTPGIQSGNVILDNVSVSGQVIMAGGVNHKISGDYAVVKVDIANAKVEIQKGTVEKLVIGKIGANSTIIINKDALVNTINANVPAVIKGEGSIKNAQVSEDVKIEQKPGTVSILPQNSIVPQPEIKPILKPEEKPVPEEQKTPVQSITEYIVEPGTVVGSILIIYTAGKDNSLVYSRQLGAFSTPFTGTVLETTGTIYTTGNDIIGVSAGEHIGLYEIDMNRRIVKFADITVWSQYIAAPKPDAQVVTGCNLLPGSVPGSIKINYIPGSGNSLRYVKQTGIFDTPKEGDDASTIGTEYVIGSDIVGTQFGEQIGVYEVNSANKIVKFGVLTVNINYSTLTESTGLHNIALSGNPMNFYFIKDIIGYYGVMVDNEFSSITVIPTGDGKITVNGSQVVSGTASAPISLETNIEKEINVVQTENGRIPKTYTIRVIRQSAKSADLQNITISGSPSNFVFEQSKYEYKNLTVLNDVESIAITATGDGEMTITNDSDTNSKGQRIASGVPCAPISLIPGKTINIVIGVIQSNSIPKYYRIEILRNAK